MKINLAVVLDEMTIFKPMYHGKTDYEMDLTRAAILRPDIQVVRPDCLYVVDSDSENLDSLGPGTRVLCCDPELSDRCIERFDQLIVLESAASAVAVLNELVAVFTKYEIWEQGMLTRIATRKTIKEDLDYCARLLYNPIQLASPSMSYIEYGGTLPDNIDDTLWSVSFGKGYADISLIPPGYREYSDKRMYEDFDMAVLPTNKRFKGHTETAVIPLMHGSEIIGMLATLDDTQPFTTGQLSLFRAIRTYVEYALTREDEDFEASETYQKLFVHLTEGRPVDPASLRYFFELRGHSIDDPYRAYVFELGEEHKRTRESPRGLMAQIKDITHCEFLYRFESHVVAIVFRSKRPDSPEAAHGRALIESPLFSHFLRQHDLICGVSTLNTGLLNLATAYRQGVFSVRRYESARTSARAIVFEDIYEDVLLSSLGESVDVRVFAHPLLNAFSKTVRPLEYAQCARMYIVSGFNMKRAAQMLFMNKNSLQYRIKRIEDLLGKKMRDMSESELLSMWIATLYVERNVQY